MRESARRFGWLFLALAVIGGVAWYVTSRRQSDVAPTFESQVQDLGSIWATTRREAASGLVRFPTKKTEAVAALTKALDDKDEEVRRNALGSLQTFGVASKPAAPRLLELAGRDPSPAVRRAALGLLAGLKSMEVVPLLLAALDDSDPKTRAEAARGLSLLGPKADAPGAVDKLLGLVGTDQPEIVRVAAVEALQALAHDKEDVNRKLVEVVLAGDPSPAVRGQVLAGLRTATYSDRVAAILGGLEDSSPPIRLMAGGHLARIGVDDERAIPALCRAALKADEATDEGMAANLEQVMFQPTEPLSDEALASRYASAARELKAVVESKRGAVRPAALHLLTRFIASYKKTPKPYLAEPAKLGVDVILGRVADESEDMPFRIQAMNQWTTIVAGPSAPGADEALRPSAVWLLRLAELLKSKAEPIRARAAEVLVDSSAKNLDDVSIRDVWKQLVPSLVEALKSDDPKTAAAALAVLGNMGPEAAGSLEAVRALAASGEDPAAPAAREAVKRIGALEDLRSEDPAVRSAAAAILGGMGWRSLPALPSLKEALKDPDPKVQAAALGALDGIVPREPSTLDAHLEALRSGEPDVRLAGARYPEPPPTDAVVQALGAVLGDSSPEVAKAAATALASLVGANPLVIPTLFQALGESDPRKPVVLDALFAHLADVTAMADYSRSRRDDRAANRPPDATFQAIVAAATPPLQAALRSSDPDVRMAGAAYLGRLVQASRLTREAATRKALEPGLASLLAALEGDDAEVRDDVVERLKEIRLQPSAVVAGLLELLEKPQDQVSTEVRTQVFKVLLELARDARSDPEVTDALSAAEPAATVALKDRAPEVREAATRLLAALGASAKKAETPK